MSYMTLAYTNMKMLPQQQQSGKNGGGSDQMMQQMVTMRPIRIIRMKSNSDVDGNYKYMYETENGIMMQEQGFVKQVQGGGGDKKEGHHINVAQGSYSYTSPEGTPVKVMYIADENGFQVLENEEDMNMPPSSGGNGGKQRPQPQRPPKPTTTTTTESPEPEDEPNPYFNEHILKLGTTQQFYKFFHENNENNKPTLVYGRRPDNNDDEEDDESEQYDGY